MKKQILEKLNIINTATEQIRELLTSITITSAGWIDEKLMKVQWEYLGEGDPLVDIEIRDATEGGSWLSMKSYNKNWDIKASKGEHLVGLGEKNTDKNKWEVRIWVLDDPKIVSDTELLSPRKQDQDEEDSPMNKLVGFWDGYLAPIEGVNLYKTYPGEDGISNAIEKGCKIAFMISGFNKNMTEYEIRKRWRDKAQQLTTKIRENLELVYVMDEPISKGFSVEKMEEMVRIGKEEFGSFKFGYSHTGDHSLSNRPFPENVDFVGINLYRFYYPEADHVTQLGEEYYIETEEEFIDFAEQHLDSIRKKVPGAEIVITGQAFYYKDHKKKKYRIPPDESPLWYAELLRRNDDVISLLWYTWKDRSESYGTESLSEKYKENQRKAFERIT